ncbi:MAG TPA: hypothetical protein VN457_08080, partial [Chlamydiales bacterium]|nr:hypothetical protein [Chlamydiales bacterium]
MSVPAAVAPPQVPSTQVSASSLPPSASASQLAAPRATAGFLRPRHIEDLRTQVAKSDYGRLRRQAQLFGKVLPHAFLEKMPDVALQLSDLVIFAWNQGKTEKKQRQEKEREALQKAQMKEGAPPQLAEKPEKAEKGSAPATLANTSSSSSSAPASTGDPKDDDAINSDTVNKMILQFQRYQVYIKTSSGSSEEFTLKCSDGEVKCNLGLITFWCDLSPDANALEKLKRKLPRSRKTLEAFKQYLYTGYFPSSFDLNVLDSMRLLIELMQFLQEFQRPALVAEIETQL